ncbi:MAG: YceI family protein [Bacteroidota bacterium]
MKKLTLLLSSLFVFAVVAKSQELKINDAGVKISFTFPADNCTGTIGGLDAHITFDAAKPESAVIYGSVKVSTINTGTPKRDDHLKSADYFDAVKYPTIDFKAKKVEKTAKGFKMTGIMIIKNVEKEVVFNFTYTDLTFKASAVIYVKDFGMMVKKEREATKTTISITIPILG